MPQIIRAVGPKWQLVWQLTQQPIWPQLLAGKKAVMLPDDDVILDTCAINRCLACLLASGAGGLAHKGGCQPVSAVQHLCGCCAPCTPTCADGHQSLRSTWLPCRAFELFTAYGLLLGQPSLCPVEHRASWWAQAAGAAAWARERLLGCGMPCSTGRSTVKLSETTRRLAASSSALCSCSPSFLFAPLPCRYLHLVQRPQFTLRFVTMVEIMVGAGHSAAAAAVRCS